jgi:hypothetical protein
VNTGIYSIKTNRYFDEDIMRDYESSYITYPYFVQAYCIVEGRPQKGCIGRGSSKPVEGLGVRRVTLHYRAVVPARGARPAIER